MMEKRFSSSHLIQRLELNDRIPIRLPLYAVHADLNHLQSIPFLKRAKYITRISDVLQKKLRKTLKLLKSRLAKQIKTLPYIPAKRCQIYRKAFSRLENVYMQFYERADWRDFVSKAGFKNLFLSTNTMGESRSLDPITRFSLMENLKTKIDLFTRHFRRQKNLQSLSYSGCLDEIYGYFIRILDKNAPILKKFHVLKIQVFEDWNIPAMKPNTYKVFEKLKELEFKTRGELPFLQHFEQNIHYCVNLESLAIRIQDIDQNASLSPLLKVQDLPNLKLYCLYITRMTPKHLFEMFKFYACPKQIEKVKVYILDSVGWVEFKKPDEEGGLDKDKIGNAWAGLNNLKEIHMGVQSDVSDKSIFLGMMRVMFVGAPYLESFTLEFRLREAVDDPFTWTEFTSAAMFDFYDFLKGFMPFAKNLRSISLNYPLVNISRLCDYTDPFQFKSISLQNSVIGFETFQYFYEHSIHKKDMVIFMDRILIDSAENLALGFEGISGLQKTVKAQFTFRIKETLAEGMVVDCLIQLIRKLNHRMDLSLKIFFKNFTRRSLEHIGRAALSNRNFTKLEIRCKKYLFLIGQNDTTYIILNVDLDSESDSSEDSEDAEESDESGK